MFPTMERAAGVLIAARVAAAGGKVSNARVIHDFGAGRGGIDGMTVTTDGRIVAASAFEMETGRAQFSPLMEKILDSIAVPGSWLPTSNLAATTAKCCTSARARACTGSRPP